LGPEFGIEIKPSVFAENSDAKSRFDELEIKGNHPFQYDWAMSPFIAETGSFLKIF
jgi:hypothetical protein